MELAAINLHRRLLNVSNDSYGGGHIPNHHTYYVVLIACVVYLFCTFYVSIFLAIFLEDDSGSPAVAERPMAVAERPMAVAEQPMVVAAYRSDSECSICLGDFADGERIRIVSNCGHRFHVGCIDAWLLSHDSCPNCRNFLPNSSK